MTDDHVFESPEEFTLQLHSTTTSIMLHPDTATINIADNDSELAGCSYTYTTYLFIYTPVYWESR